MTETIVLLLIITHQASFDRVHKNVTTIPFKDRPACEAARQQLIDAKPRQAKRVFCLDNAVAQKQ